MKRSRKVLMTTLVVGATGAVAGLGVFAAFTAQTSNIGNSIAAGTVVLSDSSSGTALYVLPAAGPSAVPAQRCIRVTYGGSLPATVKMFRTGTVNNGTAFNLKIERGTGVTGTFPDCTGFVPVAQVWPTLPALSAPLGTFPISTGTTIDVKGSAWNNADFQDYRLSISVADDPSVNMHTTPMLSGSHGFTWEATNN